MWTENYLGSLSDAAANMRCSCVHAAISDPLVMDPVMCIVSKAVSLPRIDKSQELLDRVATPVLGEGGIGLGRSYCCARYLPSSGPSD